MTLPTSQDVVIAVVVAVAIVAVVRFEMLCFKDLAGRRHAELSYLSRTGWTVLIAIMIPIGGICYLFCGRTR